MVNLQVDTNGYPGRFMISWEMLRGTKVYEVQTSTDPTDESKWKSQPPVTASKLKIDGLTSGQRRYVCAPGLRSGFAVGLVGLGRELLAAALGFHGGDEPFVLTGQVLGQRLPCRLAAIPGNHLGNKGRLAAL